jgi:hypothetical protein
MRQDTPPQKVAGKWWLTLVARAQGGLTLGLELDADFCHLGKKMVIKSAPSLPLHSPTRRRFKILFGNHPQNATSSFPF